MPHRVLSLTVFYLVRIVKLLTQHVVRGDSRVFNDGSLLIGGRATSRQFAFMTVSKWAATFPQLNSIRLAA